MQKRFWHRINLIRWLLGLTMVGALLAIFAGMRVQPLARSKAAPADELARHDADLTLSNFDYCDVREGHARLTLQAVSARYFNETQETVLSQVEAVFLLKKGGKIELQADEGVVRNDNKNVEIRGNVRLNYEDSYRLVTERLTYVPDKELIHTSAKVVVQGQDLTLKGVGMQLKLGESTLTILNQVESELQGILFSQRQGQEKSSLAGEE